MNGRGQLHRLVSIRTRAQVVHQAIAVHEAPIRQHFLLLCLEPRLHHIEWSHCKWNYLQKCDKRESGGTYWRVRLGWLRCTMIISVDMVARGIACRPCGGQCPPPIDLCVCTSFCGAKWFCIANFKGAATWSRSDTNNILKPNCRPISQGCLQL